jgi:hypothetical protein
MRVYVATALLVLCGLVGYASSAVSTQAESPQAAITIGEKLTLAFDPERAGYQCTVTAVRGDFVGCAPGDARIGIGRPASEHWYNLRLVARIDRSPN